MTVYHHTSSGKAVVAAYRLTAVLILLVSTFPIALFAVKIVQLGEVPTVFCCALTGTLIGWGVAWIFFNFYPEISIDDQGIQISNMFSRVKILWRDLIDCDTGRPPVGSTLVRAKRITPFHILYGWMFAHSFLPAFIIGSTIEDRDDLIRQINIHLANMELEK